MTEREQLEQQLIDRENFEELEAAWDFDNGVQRAPRTQTKEQSNKEQNNKEEIKQDTKSPGKFGLGSSGMSYSSENNAGFSQLAACFAVRALVLQFLQLQGPSSTVCNTYRLNLITASHLNSFSYQSIDILLLLDLVLRDALPV